MFQAESKGKILRIGVEAATANLEPAEELNNLMVDPKHQDRLVEKRGKLIEYQKQTGGESFIDLLPAPETGDTPVAAKGLPLCSRCPGSTTPGKGNP